MAKQAAIPSIQVEPLLSATDKLKTISKTLDDLEVRITKLEEAEP